MTKAEFVDNVRQLYDYQQAINRMEDILGVYLSEGVLGNIVNAYGELIIKSVVHCNIDNLSDEILSKFWDTILNYGDKCNTVEELYEELTNL